MSVEDLVERALDEKARDIAAVPDVAALVASGVQARRRRRLMNVTAIAAMAVIATVTAGPMVWPRAEPPVSGVPSSAASPEATATVGPGRATGYFAGSFPEVPVTFTLPAGWETDGSFINKMNADPIFGLVLMDVGNIYTDGCDWSLVTPQPGPTVDDLVAAYADTPQLKATPARPITVDGFTGKQIQITIPDYKQKECTDGKFGILQEDNAGGLGPSLWAQAPQQLNTLSILDVAGTRLVILAGDPGNLTTQDRTDQDTILTSLQIG